MKYDGDGGTVRVWKFCTVLVMVRSHLDFRVPKMHINRVCLLCFPTVTVTRRKAAVTCGTVAVHHSFLINGPVVLPNDGPTALVQWSRLSIMLRLNVNR